MKIPGGASRWPPLAATWIGDAAAYFAGTAWGKGRARLAPNISPNKSWVGFWASLAGGSAAAVGWLFVAGGRLPGLTGAGVLPFALIGAVLGHSVITTTQRYAHLYDEEVRKAVDIVAFPADDTR